MHMINTNKNASSRFILKNTVYSSKSQNKLNYKESKTFLCKKLVRLKLYDNLIKTKKNFIQLFCNLFVQENTKLLILLMNIKEID